MTGHGYTPTRQEYDFFDHLDHCQQCREHPFELCAVGAVLIHREAVKEDIGRMEALIAERERP